MSVNSSQYFGLSFCLYSIWQVQFLQYLNALSHDDYVASLDNLHRYFDYRSVPDLQPYGLDILTTFFYDCYFDTCSVHLSKCLMVRPELFLEVN